MIGLPLRMDGTEGTRVEKTKKFARWLSTFIQLPVRFWDERLTTKQAEKILDEQKIKHKTKKNLTDQISAAIILSSYLEGRQYNDDSQNP